MAFLHVRIWGTYEMRGRKWMLAVLILGVLVAAISLSQTDRRYGERSAVLHNVPAATGTADASDGLAVSTLGTLLSEVDSLGGAEDWTELVGRRVRLVVDTNLITNNVAFWTGTPPDDLLVVIERDRRSGREQQLGRPSENPFAQVYGTRQATIEGVVEPLPYAEAMFTWGLTRRDVDLLADRGVYLRARELTSTTPDREP